MPDESIRDMLWRANRWRQFARLFSDERTRLGLLATAAKLEQRARQMTREQPREAAIPGHESEL
jgi:hypothetical protein